MVLVEKPYAVCWSLFRVYLRQDSVRIMFSHSQTIPELHRDLKAFITKDSVSLERVMTRSSTLDALSKYSQADPQTNCNPTFFCWFLRMELGSQVLWSTSTLLCGIGSVFWKLLSCGLSKKIQRNFLGSCITSWKSPWTDLHFSRLQGSRLDSRKVGTRTLASNSGYSCLEI
jgi:hypothetical protein